ncbi:hypothetical protein [Photobacterium phosphoreum]|uniref:hypothetical protein n=1 Tax=Photobacterium phosphoreum TaxID=659 RepID=UPI0024B6BCDC|nr:hypothetical protein [Photobacterium phosphoreum]
MNKLLVEALLQLASVALDKLEKDEELQDKVISKFRGIADLIQEKSGRVNVHDMDTAIQLSLDTAIKRDKETMCQVLSVITTLYATTDVKRGAISGGTLLKFFGEDVFPHIDQRELRFAKHINDKVYKNVLATIEANFDEKVSNYLVKDYADFSNVQPRGTICAIEGILRPVMKNGSKIFNFIKNVNR